MRLFILTLVCTLCSVGLEANENSIYMNIPSTREDFFVHDRDFYDEQQDSVQDYIFDVVHVRPRADNTCDHCRRKRQDNPNKK